MGWDADEAVVHPPHIKLVMGFILMPFAESVGACPGVDASSWND
jgi:hypothetical protein